MIFNNAKRLHFVLLTTILFLSLGEFVGAFWADSHLGKIDPAGIEKVVITRYNSKDGALWLELDSLIVEFDSRGNTISESKTATDGVVEFAYSYLYEEDRLLSMHGKRLVGEEFLEFSYLYTYDNHGRQIEGTKYSLEGDVISVYTARYDEKGNFVEGNDRSFESSTGSRYIARYDDNGNLLEEKRCIVYDYKGSEGLQLEYKCAYEYDEDNNLVAEIGYDEYEEVTYSYTYQYDQPGNLVQALSYGPNGKIITEYRAEYDEESNLHRFTMYDGQGNVVVRHEAQYELGKMISEYDCLKDPAKLLYSASYDEDGRVLEEINYDKYLSGAFITYSYEFRYDERGNCIEEIYRVFFEDEQEWRAISRNTYTISYYD